MKSYVLVLSSTLFLLFLSKINAQEVVSSSGKTYTNDMGSISWTLGESVIASHIQTDQILTQGFHQSKLTITGTNNLQSLDLDLSIFPNPSSTWFQIELKEWPFNEQLSFDISNLIGKQLHQGKNQFSFHKYQ